MKVKTYINEGQAGQPRFTGFKPGDVLVPGPVVDVALKDAIWLAPDRDLAIAERVFAIGNRMDVDDESRPWPSTTRSLSVGDVIVVRETAYQCADMGWEPVDTGDLLRSLGEYGPTR